jgi:hypothetical protein
MKPFARPRSNVVRTREPSAAEPYREQELAEPQRQALEALRERGIFVTTFMDLVADAELWRELQADMDDYVGRARRQTPRLATVIGKPRHKDEFLIRRWGGVVDDPPIDPESPWLRFVASDRLLDVVNSYRGVYTKLVGLDNVYTVPFKKSGARVASQRWHRDPEDLHVVKCFLYFSDVDEESGPFEYVQGSAGDGPYGDLWRWGTTWRDERGNEEHWYPPTEELEAKVPESDRLRLTGPKGTMILCDTSGFHRGGYARTKPRVLSIHTYVSPTAEYRNMNFSIAWRNGAGEGSFSEQGRYALA